MKIQQIVDSVFNGTLNIPSFQRGYVWQPARQAKLIDSLYHDYPIGVITTWTQVQGNGNGTAIDMVVDGQQRIASIYVCCTDTAPATYGVDEAKPRTGLYFHILNENFGFPPPRERSTDPMWVKVSNLFGDPHDVATRAWRTQIKNSPDYNEKNKTCMMSASIVSKTSKSEISHSTQSQAAAQLTKLSKCSIASIVKTRPSDEKTSK